MEKNLKMLTTFEDKNLQCQVLSVFTKVVSLHGQSFLKIPSKCMNFFTFKILWLYGN